MVSRIIVHGVLLCCHSILRMNVGVVKNSARMEQAYPCTGAGGSVQAVRRRAVLS